MKNLSCKNCGHALSVHEGKRCLRIDCQCGAIRISPFSRLTIKGSA